MEIIIDKDIQPLVVHIVDETNTDLGNTDKSTLVINGLIAEVIKLNIEKERAQTEAERKHAEYLQQLIDEHKVENEQKRLRLLAKAEKARLDKIEEDTRKAKIAEQKRQDKVAEAERLYKIKMQEEEKKRQAKEQEDIKKKEAEATKELWKTIGLCIGAAVSISSIVYGASK